MLFRFSLYGFLKNQKYYEPFLILAFREKGLSFFMIGLLVGFGKVCVNLFEIPTGVIADMYGRRRSMIFSFSAYITAFVTFALSPWIWSLFLAMFLYSAGEAFRTGTHKAMIFDWLKHVGREKEKTKFYGFTRSWSQMGSALSVLIAATIVIVSQDYSCIFWFSIIPYLIGIINFLGYPEYLDGELEKSVSLKATLARLKAALIDLWNNRPLRGLFTESMIFKGSYTVSKEYLQPLLKQTAIAIPIFVGLAEKKRAAILVGAVFFVLYLVSSYASRISHTVCDRAGGERAASRWLWTMQLLLFAAMIPTFVYHVYWAAIGAFVVVAVLQNTWRPILMSRIDDCTDSRVGATVLSLDSQLEAVFVMIGAPLIGLLVDHTGFWVVGVFGTAAAITAIALTTRSGLLTPRQPA